MRRRACANCEGKQNRERSDRLTKAIREFKDSAHAPIDAQREKELVKQLESLDHPNIDGLVAWVKAEREASQLKNNRKGGRR